MHSFKVYQKKLIICGLTNKISFDFAGKKFKKHLKKRRKRRKRKKLKEEKKLRILN